MSKRKVKERWLEEPPSALTSARGENPPGPDPSHHTLGQTNGAGDEALVSAAPGSEQISRDMSDLESNQPEPFSLVPATVPSPEEPFEPTALPLQAAAIPVARIAPVAEVASLEQRIRRLEEALAQLQAAQSSAPLPREQFTEQRPAALPPAPTPAAPGKGLLDLVRRNIGRADAPTAAPDPPTAVALIPVGARRRWQLMDTVAELRAMARMFVDPRYRMSKAVWIVCLVLLVALLLSYWWVPGTIIPLFGYWINKAADLALAYTLLKVLTYEARRYRETAPDLPPSLRL